MAKAKIKIQAFNGYGFEQQIYCRGRVLVDKNIPTSPNDSVWKHFVSVYQQAESDEIPFQKIQANAQSFSKEYTTNSEGFFWVNNEIVPDFDNSKRIRKIDFHINATDFQKKWIKKPIQSKGNIFYPSAKAKFGVISDIDDTILRTGVLSPFKWKIFYNTLFKKASERVVVRNADNWFRQLYNGLDNNSNPFFYVSHSPWNLYEYLLEFLHINQFPLGPIFLRDFGKKPKDALQSYRNHKHNEISAILKMYPHLPFILVGDGGEKDAMIYLKLHQLFPEQIKAIFIRRIGDKNHQKKIERKSKKYDCNCFYFVKNFKDAADISKELGFVL